MQKPEACTETVKIQCNHLVRKFNPDVKYCKLYHCICLSCFYKEPNCPVCHTDFVSDDDDDILLNQFIRPTDYARYGIIDSRYENIKDNDSFTEPQERSICRSKSYGRIENRLEYEKQLKRLRKDCRKTIFLSLWDTTLDLVCKAIPVSKKSVTLKRTKAALSRLVRRLGRPAFDFLELTERESIRYGLWMLASFFIIKAMTKKKPTIPFSKALAGFLKMAR